MDPGSGASKINPGSMIFAKYSETQQHIGSCMGNQYIYLYCRTVLKKYQQWFSLSAACYISRVEGEALNTTWEI